MPGPGAGSDAPAAGNPLAQAPAAPARDDAGRAGADAGSAGSGPRRAAPRPHRLDPAGWLAGSSRERRHGLRQRQPLGDRLRSPAPAGASRAPPIPSPPAQHGAAPAASAAGATPEPPKAQERVATPPAGDDALGRSGPDRQRSSRRCSTPAPRRGGDPQPAAAISRSSSPRPGSEAEARATFSALQRKYPDQLGGQAPIVRKTELAGGKTVYRLRVGPYSRDDATTMCTALQAAGGQCFIAKN